MPKISLIIPTRNGADYIWAPIKTILSQDYSDIELLVSVNHSTDNTLEILRQFQDPRLRVIVPPRPLSMTSHYEWCLQQATGEWVTIIGDDDGVMPYFFPEIEKLLNRYDSKPVDAFIFRRAYYFWPGCDDVYGKKVIRACAGRSIKKLSGKLSVLRAILFDFDHFDLPQVYTNNLVRRSLIENIRSISAGKFYNELNPDVYSGVAVALKARSIVRSELPLFWSGTSPKSVSIAFAKSKNSNRNHKSELDNEVIVRAREFLALAQNDNIDIAPMVGMDAWLGLESSAIFVLSALMMIPFKVPWLLRQHMLLLFGACARTSVSLQWERDQALRAKKICLLQDVIRRNGLKLGLFSGVTFLISPILKTSWLISRSINRISDFQKQVFNVESDSHVEFPDLIAAYLAVEKKYYQSQANLPKAKFSIPSSRH